MKENTENKKKMENNSKKAVGTMLMFTVIIASSLFTAVIPCMAAEPPNTNIIVTAEPIEEIQTIQELQQWVYAQGYSYTVAENGVTRLSPEDRRALCGYKSLKAPKESVSENVRFFSDITTPKAETKKSGLLPSSYDAMALGYATPVKNQGACGSCWIFGQIAQFESGVLINENNEFDFSEQEAGDCNIWSSIGGYNYCNGGNAFMMTNYFTKYGSADEACHPYAATPQACQNCSPLRNVDNWRIITDYYGESQITTIKNAILTYGPVHSTIYASDPCFRAYSGGVYEYWRSEPTNHAIEIIGWNDSLPHSHGEGGWLIKNSWGTSWGASGPHPGCAWVAYGAANLGDYTSTISGYKNPGDVIFYHDECGWMGYCFGYNNPVAYGAVRFTPSRDTTLTTVDFWAVDANMDYEIKIFDKLNTFPDYYTFGDQLGITQTGSTNEPGYYSVKMKTPVQLTSVDDFIVQVKLMTTGWKYPIPIDYCTVPWMNWTAIVTFSGESYCSRDGSKFEKTDIGVGEYVDIGIRARADWNPWDDTDSDGGEKITDTEIQEAVFCWLTDTPAPKTGEKITDERIQELVYKWLAE